MIEYVYCALQNDNTGRPGKRHLVPLNELRNYAYAKNKIGVYENLQIRNKNDDIINYKLSFDIDNSNLEQAYYDTTKLVTWLTRWYFLPKFIKVYFSGSKGFHIEVYTPIIPDVDLKLLHYAWKGFAKFFESVEFNIKLDKSIYCGGQGRLWRCANSIHPKTGLYKRYLTHEQLYNLSIKDIQELAKTPLKQDPILDKRGLSKHIRTLKKIATKYKYKETNQKTYKINDNINLTKVNETDTYIIYICPKCGDDRLYIYINSKVPYAICSRETCKNKIEMIMEK